MIMEITIRSIFGGEIYVHESDDNSILKSLKAAMKTGADLRNADLRNADLRNADLRNAYLRNVYLRNADLRNAYLSDAYLRNADLSDADLRNADLRNADLSDANLRNADLRNADLSNANLRNADLRNADLRNADLIGAKMPLYSKWVFSIENGTLNIGCKSKSFPEWELWFNGTEEYSTARASDDFKRLHAMFLAYKAYYEFMES